MRPTRRSRSEELVGERYRGIRPAFGYPACPDHSEKEKLFALLGARGRRARADRDVRDHPRRERQRHLLRAPASRATSRSGRIGLDQVDDYAARKGVPLAEAERWLRPNLGYEVAVEAVR